MLSSPYIDRKEFISGRRDCKKQRNTFFVVMNALALIVVILYIIGFLWRSYEEVVMLTRPTVHLYKRDSSSTSGYEILAPARIRLATNAVTAPEKLQIVPYGQYLIDIGAGDRKKQLRRDIAVQTPLRLLVFVVECMLMHWHIRHCNAHWGLLYCAVVNCVYVATRTGIAKVIEGVTNDPIAMNLLK